MCYSHLGVALRFNFRRSGCGSLKDSSYDAEGCRISRREPMESDLRRGATDRAL